MPKGVTYRILEEWGVEVVCPVCGHTHEVTSRLPLEDGPRVPVMVAAFFEGREWPDAVKACLWRPMRCPRLKAFFTVDPRGRRTVLIPAEWARRLPLSRMDWKMVGTPGPGRRRSGRRRVRAYGHDGDQVLVRDPWWTSPLESMAEPLEEDLQNAVVVGAWISEDGLQGEVIIVEID